MAKKPKIFLLHGFLGVGKTTLAKQLELEHDAIRFTHDEWMSHLYGDDPPVTEFADYAGRVSVLIERVWTRCVEVNASVVLDFGFWSRAERDRTRDLGLSIGGEPTLINLHCSEEVALQRISKRNEEPDGSLFISPNTYQVLKQRFESLSPDEARKDISTSEN